MSHFAEIDNNNIVQRVIVAEQDFINSGAVGDAFRWIQTSYNNNFRKNYAGKGFTYDRVRDAFIPPQPYDSWVLNEDTCQWEAPVPYPEETDAEGNPVMYSWDEEIVSWVEVTGE